MRASDPPGSLRTPHFTANPSRRSESFTPVIPAKAGIHFAVAVVVDFGLRAIAPKGESVQPTIRKCVSAKPGTNGLEILTKATSVRTSAEGFVCGLASYPAKECSTEITTPKSLLKK